MASAVTSAFREALADGLSRAAAERIRLAAGGGPEVREIHRALMLADRAIREWAAQAVAVSRPGSENQFELLGRVARPEDAPQSVQPAASFEQRAAATADERAIANAASTLADAVGELDTETPVALQQNALRACGAAAGNLLIASGVLLGGDEFVIARADEALEDLIALRGWQNELGPRYELPGG